MSDTAGPGWYVTGDTTTCSSMADIRWGNPGFLSGEFKGYTWECYVNQKDDVILKFGCQELKYEDWYICNEEVAVMNVPKQADKFTAEIYRILALIEDEANNGRI